jgi:hypothetical protein
MIVIPQLIAPSFGRESFFGCSNDAMRLSYVIEDSYKIQHCTVELTSGTYMFKAARLQSLPKQA